MDEKEENTINKEETPSWAKNLQETLNDLPNRLKEALTPQEQETDPEAPQEIPVPQIPEQEVPPQPEEQEAPQEQEQEKPKKKKFLDWLM